MWFVEEEEESYQFQEDIFHLVSLIGIIGMGQIGKHGGLWNVHAHIPQKCQDRLDGSKGSELGEFSTASS